MVYNVYRPPSGIVHNFIDLLTKSWKNEHNIISKEVVYLGDFNINYLSKRDDNTKKLVRWQNKMGLSQLTKSHTQVYTNQCI